MRHGIALSAEGSTSNHRVSLGGGEDRRRIAIDDHPAAQTRLVPLGGGRYEVVIGAAPGATADRVRTGAASADGFRTGDGDAAGPAAPPAALRTVVRAEVHGDTVYLAAFGRSFALTVLDPVEQAHAAGRPAELACRAPMPGVVVALHAAAGETVREGQAIMTIESMKLLTVITAPGGGLVEQIGFGVGASFGKGALLARIHAAQTDSMTTGQTGPEAAKRSEAAAAPQATRAARQPPGTTES